jgi:hypothetical protein
MAYATTSLDALAVHPTTTSFAPVRSAYTFVGASGPSVELASPLGGDAPEDGDEPPCC